MSSFTDTIIISPVTPSKSRLPAGMVAAQWRLERGFSYAVGSIEDPVMIIEVPAGFVFDGASVPFWASWLFPCVHPIYLQAAALHDWLYTSHPPQISRAMADSIFYESMMVLKTPRAYAAIMWAAVRAGGWRSWVE